MVPTSTTTTISLEEQEQQTLLSKNSIVCANHDAVVPKVDTKDNANETTAVVVVEATIDISKSILGTNRLVNFPILKHSSQVSKIPPLRFLQLQIDPIIPGVMTDTTTAKYLYSCMYRFRVHGEPSLASY